MKKTVIALMFLMSLPLYAQAEVESSVTSNFTVEVIEESLGLNVSGSTDLGRISRSSSPEIVFSGMRVSNQGEVKGYLYAEVGELSGLSFGNSEGNLQSVTLVDGSNEIERLDQSEKILSGLMSNADTDGDADGINPGETLSSFNVVFSVNKRLPVGRLSMQIKWILKTQ
ncbi:hypothetical protein [Brevibacillus reuszeri]|uniref:hypothetical protein n=1 Tax=Brevibacillus reuszeri TaxID=54915 RepID=UPI000CCBF182|nr:hypothetical protein [Brevibacillus reuszeri]